jgi:hypothetical protein
MCKLPDLDMNDSLQGKIEQAIDEKFGQHVKKINRRQQRDRSKVRNVFFSGLSGTTMTSTETIVLSTLQEYDSGNKDPTDPAASTVKQLWFCLPCDIKDEVHSKPPSYRHVHSLQYGSTNKPPRLETVSDDVCQCFSSCGDDCINRMLYTECFGDPTKMKKDGVSVEETNCAVGPNCSNRQLGQRSIAKCKPKREKGKGWGLHIVNKARKGDLIQEYVGEVVDEKTKVKRLNEWYDEHPNDPNFYLMALQPGWFIDARDVANLSRFINHSCDPNCVLQQINVNGRMRCGIFALRDIQPDEFLSYDYHFDTQHGDRFMCCCGSLNCRGTMKNVKLDDAALKLLVKSKSEIWEQAKAGFERDKKFLIDYEDDRVRRSTQVGALVPSAEFGNEFVANGAHDKYRNQGQRHRLFLWRNLSLGNDMATRLTRYVSK